MYDDVSLKLPSVDPPNQMMEDSEEQSMQDDPVLVNRWFARYLALVQSVSRNVWLRDCSAPAATF